MELKRVFIDDSPLECGWARLTGEVEYDAPNMGPETYWFDVPGKYSEYLSSSGNPWAVALIPLAATLWEPLKLCLPVDEKLYRNIPPLLSIWKSWYPHLHQIEIKADVEKPGNADGGRSRGLFFTGGVDSFFSLLRLAEGAGPGKGVPLDDLLTVWGFDIPFSNGEAFRRVVDKTAGIASHLGLTTIDIATNLKETECRRVNWGFLYHGSALAAVGLALEKRYRSVTISSSAGLGNLTPWGSHPHTDPLLSTANTAMVHYGTDFTRAEKTEFLSVHDLALKNLRVCYKRGTDDNCSACVKCLRTMITLHDYGASFAGFIKKQLQQQKFREMLEARYPKLPLFLASYLAVSPRILEAEGRLKRIRLALTKRSAGMIRGYGPENGLIMTLPGKK